MDIHSIICLILIPIYKKYLLIRGLSLKLPKTKRTLLYIKNKNRTDETNSTWEKKVSIKYFIYLVGISYQKLKTHLISFRLLLYSKLTVVFICDFCMG